jgi:hypothetical protein
MRDYCGANSGRRTEEQLMKYLMLFLLGVVGSTQAALAQERGDVLVVTSATALVYQAPNDKEKTTMTIRHGRRIEAAGTAIKGFVPLITKSGGQVWVRVADVAPETPKENAVASPKEVLPASAPPASPPSVIKKKASIIKDESIAGEPSIGQSLHNRYGIEALAFDVDVTSGSYFDYSYTEFEFGLSTFFFNRFVAWHNAAFSHFSQRGPSGIYGLDTGARGVLGVSVMSVFAGPGYRFANQANSAPFVEGGVIFKLGGIGFGGGTKVLLDSVVSRGLPNDTQYFVFFAAGSGL